MTPKSKPRDRSFDYTFNIKEKKITLPEYIILKKAFSEGLLITKEWLENISTNNPEYKGLIDKVLNHISFQMAEYDLRILESYRTADKETGELFKFLDTQVVLRPSVVTKTTSRRTTARRNTSRKVVKVTVPPEIKTKEELKNEINFLYQQKDNYDQCLNKTSELLQHPDLTGEERIRYEQFYHELLEWVNLKNEQSERKTKKQETVPVQNTGFAVSESRGTSISQLRTDMMKELQKLRQLYIDPNNK